jgi:hypothetical protein
MRWNPAIELIYSVGNLKGGRGIPIDLSNLKFADFQSHCHRRATIGTRTNASFGHTSGIIKKSKKLREEREGQCKDYRGTFGQLAI